ncbi:hypothetical protein CLAFUW4_14632 [Fulvia fulva]|uniref:Uncharacterized protein n=1 Tax=Passalora fulva TaxID=5499 RepID=A0A9Q8UWG9_PASFU|nr:uncharacterized protein CLAFUR5_14461 [Fulvia fulva]KAK4609075.1 hypothetical protein CLAFUR4_14626 [Fulvia fulva]KAK4609837.1 hypothetical protein CLAFUR0_14626 [Fulvia fulva]UJO24985.1 hypothetical protein CLAFUR5_14461 [Fulvia fulva]WPV22603.1 hypothetical protein CLAFUW4_14632 [Fulvia fulva]WPV37381.1 hypothetical protein CLAFUW7_14635 [Fulvia fulva]
MRNKKNSNEIVEYPDLEVCLKQNSAYVEELDDDFANLRPGPFSIEIKIEKYKTSERGVLAFDIKLDKKLVAQLCVPQAYIEANGSYTHTIASITNEGLRTRLEASQSLREVTVLISKGEDSISPGYDDKAGHTHWMVEPKGEPVMITSANDMKGDDISVIYLKPTYKRTKMLDVMRFLVVRNHDGKKGGKGKGEKKEQ